MKNLLYSIAIVLLIVWAIAFLGYNTKGLIHILLVISLIAVIINMIMRKRAS